MNSKKFVGEHEFYVHLRAYGKPLRIKDGDVDGAFVIVFRDAETNDLVAMKSGKKFYIWSHT